MHVTAGKMCECSQLHADVLCMLQLGVSGNTVQRLPACVPTTTVHGLAEATNYSKVDTTNCSLMRVLMWNLFRFIKCFGVYESLKGCMRRNT